jgi:DNA repair protein RecO (recombination protein O)
VTRPSPKSGSVTSLKDSGFLLRKIPFSESSFILKVFTHDHGLVSFMAKGAKRQNSKLHGLLEPAIHVQYLFPGHSRSEIRLLTDVALLRDFPRVREDIVKQSLAQVFGEVLLRYTPDETEAPEFHDLLLKGLETLEAAPPDRNALQAAFASYLLEYCDLAGYKPQFRACVQCGETVSGLNIVFHVDQGGPRCGRCHREEPGSQWLRENILRWLDSVQNGNPLEGPPPGRTDAGRAEEFLLLYLGRHAGAQKPLKSVSVWHALMDGF